MSTKIEFKPTAHDKRGMRNPSSSNLVYTDLDVRIEGVEYAGNLDGFVDPRVEKLILDAPALLDTLRQIVREYEQTYDAEQSPDGKWTAAASVPVAVMVAAARLVSKHEDSTETSNATEN